MKRRKSLQVRQNQEPLLPSILPIHDVLLLGPSFDDVEHPVQSSLLALLLHEWPHMTFIDLRGLGHNPHALLRVLLHVLRGARANDIDLEGCRGGLLWVGVEWLGVAGSKKPAVDVVKAKVLDGMEGTRESRDVKSGGREGGTLDEDNGSEARDGAIESDAATGLVCGEIDKQLLCGEL